MIVFVWMDTLWNHKVNDKIYKSVFWNIIFQLNFSAVPIYFNLNLPREEIFNSSFYLLHNHLVVFALQRRTGLCSRKCNWTFFRRHQSCRTWRWYRKLYSFLHVCMLWAVLSFRVLSGKLRFWICHFSFGGIKIPSNFYFGVRLLHLEAATTFLILFRCNLRSIKIGFELSNGP